MEHNTPLPHGDHHDTQFEVSGSQDLDKNSVLAVWIEPEESWALEIGLRISQFFLIFGGVIIFAPQYYEIHRSRSSSGFSRYVCFTIITSSSLRIAYWVGRQYDAAILIQSFVMVILMLAMLELCIRVEGPPRIERSFLDFEPRYFWSWTNLLSYVQVTVILNIALIFLVLCFGWIPGVMPGFAILSLLVETGLAIPQFVQNWINASTQGLNKAMVCLWMFGDMYKLLYYFIRKVPLPFILCVIFQLVLDLAIVAQMFFYGDVSAPRQIQHYRLSDLAH